MKYVSALLIMATALLSFSNSYALDINDKAVQKAVETKDNAAMTSLINQGLEVNSRDEDGNTLLYLVLMKGNLKMAEKLIDAGADVNAPSAENGMTPLIIATSMAGRLQEESEILMEQLGSDTRSTATKIELKKYVVKQMKIANKMLKMLIKQGADVNQETPFGTPLMNAVTNDWNEEMVGVLLQSGAKINQQDRSGRTALFYAEAFENNKIEAILLSAGADINIKDNRGKTYMEVSKRDITEK